MDARVVTDPAPATTWLSVKEAAVYSGLSVSMIYRECRLKRMQHTRINGARNIRLRREWVDAWFAKGMQEAA